MDVISRSDFAPFAQWRDEAIPTPEERSAMAMELSK